MEYHHVVRSAVTSAIGLIAFAAVIQGYLLCATPLWQRALLLVSAIAPVDPGLWTDLIGIVPVALVLIVQWISDKKTARAPGKDGLPAGGS